MSLRCTSSVVRKKKKKKRWGVKPKLKTNELLLTIRYINHFSMFVFVFHVFHLTSNYIKTTLNYRGTHHICSPHYQHHSLCTQIKTNFTCHNFCDVFHPRYKKIPFRIDQNRKECSILNDVLCEGLFNFENISNVKYCIRYRPYFTHSQFY